MEHIWTMLMHKILQNHLLCAFVANLKIDTIYALYPESFCDKNLAIRKLFAFFYSGPRCPRVSESAQSAQNLKSVQSVQNGEKGPRVANLKLFLGHFVYPLDKYMGFSKQNPRFFPSRYITHNFQINPTNLK